MADPLTERNYGPQYPDGIDYPNIIHTDKILSKVYDVLLNFGMDSSQAEEAIHELLAKDIRFREFDISDIASARASDLTVSLRLSRVRAILMDSPGGMEQEAAELAIRRMIDNELLFLGYKRDDIEHGTQQFEADGLPADSDHKVSLDELVFMALGTASMCWVGGTGNSVFDSIQAAKIGNELVRSLRARGAK